MSVQQFGWVNDPSAVQSVLATLPFPRYESCADHLTGTGDGKTVLLSDAVKKVIGGHMPAQQQPRGTCFPAGTPVLMADGSEKPIEDVEVGDLVFSHNRQARKVEQIGKRAYTGDFYAVKVQGSPRLIRMTAEHPVAVFPNIQKYVSQHQYKRGPLHWTPAEKLAVKDRVLVPFGPEVSKNHVYDLSKYVTDRMAGRPGTTGAQPQIADDTVRIFQGKTNVRRFIPLDANFARLVGLFIAEGSTGGVFPDGKVILTFGGHEQVLATEAAELMRVIFGVKIKVVRDRNRKTVIRAICYSRIVAKFLRDLCGSGCHTKRIPPEVFSSSRHVRLNVLRGWLDGDGCIRTRRIPGKVMEGVECGIIGRTVSEQLTDGVWRLAISCGVHLSCRVGKKVVNRKAPAWSLMFNGKESPRVYPELAEAATRAKTWKRGTQYVRCEEGFLCKIKDISHIQVVNLPVYNLEVEEDHSYVAGGVVVHNCVSRGYSRGVDYLECVQIALGKKAEEFKLVSHAYIYGCGGCRLRRPGRRVEGQGCSAEVQGPGEGQSGSDRHVGDDAGAGAGYDLQRLSGICVQRPRLQHDAEFRRVLQR